MSNQNVVIGTNVILFALKSNKGYSYKLLQKIIDEEVPIAISVALILEYESILKLYVDKTVFTDSDIDDLINYLCKIGRKTKIHYLWRPYLKDYFDDHILEVAINSESNTIITFNKKDFLECKKLDIKVLTPKEFLLEGKNGNT